MTKRDEIRALRDELALDVYADVYAGCRPHEKQNVREAIDKGWRVVSDTEPSDEDLLKAFEAFWLAEYEPDDRPQLLAGLRAVAKLVAK